MADNYLENKMEEHRSRQGAGASQFRSTSAHRRIDHSRQMVYGPLRVLIADGCSPLGRALVAAFRSVDATVDFYDSDRRAGAQLAQSSGARFLPLGPDGASAAVKRSIADRQGLDIVVANLPSVADALVVAINPAGGSPLATDAAVIKSPDNAAIIPVVVEAVMMLALPAVRPLAAGSTFALE